MTTNDLQQMARRMRAKEHFIWYDTVSVFDGAKEQSTTWFDSYAQLARADRIRWFVNTGRQVGLSYANQPGDRLDFAAVLYGIAVDFYYPFCVEGQVVHGDVDGKIMSWIWTHYLPHRLALTFRIAQTDDMFTFQAVKAPAAGGNFGMNASFGDQNIFPGTNGLPMHQNMMPFPEPIIVPANQTISIEGRIDSPLKEYMQTLEGCPGFLDLPQCPEVDPEPGAEIPRHEMPLQADITITLFASAAKQLRDARSAAGAVGGGR